MPGAKTSTSMGNMIVDADKHAEISVLTGNCCDCASSGSRWPSQPNILSNRIPQGPGTGSIEHPLSRLTEPNGGHGIHNMPFVPVSLHGELGQQLNWRWLLYDTRPFLGQRRVDIAQGNAVLPFSPVTCRRQSCPPFSAQPSRWGSGGRS